MKEDTMAKITGLGGVFLQYDKDVEKLLEWYKHVLGLDISEYGINFLIPNETTLITFSKDRSDTVLNFSVDDLEVFMKELKDKGVEIQQEMESFEYGSFARIKNPFGQVIELAQINKEPYLKMVHEELANYNKDS